MCYCCFWHFEWPHYFIECHCTSLTPPLFCNFEWPHYLTERFGLTPLFSSCHFLLFWMTGLFHWEVWAHRTSLTPATFLLFLMIELFHGEARDHSTSISPAIFYWDACLMSGHVHMIYRVSIFPLLLQFSDNFLELSSWYCFVFHQILSLIDYVGCAIAIKIFTVFWFVFVLFLVPNGASHWVFFS